MARLSEWIENAVSLAAELWSEGRGPVLVAVAAGWFLSLGVRMLYPAVLPQLRDAFGLSLTTAGLLISGLWAAYALGQLPGGILDDHFEEGRVLVVSSVVSALALAVVVAAGSVALVFGATLLFGFATALYGVARFTLLSDIYPDHDGKAIGLTMAAGDLGNSILPPIAGVLAVAVAWQAGIGFVVPLFVVAAVALHVFVSNGSVDGYGWDDAEAEVDAASEAGDPEDPDPESLREVLVRLADAFRSRPIQVVVAIQTLGYTVWQSFTAFYPTYLVEAKGIAPTTATAMFGGFFAHGILVKPVAGSAYDEYGLRRSLPVLLVGITVALFLLPFVEGFLAIAGVTALASTLLGYGTITLTFLTDSLPEAVQGTSLGALRTGYMGLGAVGPTIFGALADAGFFDEAFLLLGIVAATMFSLCWLVPPDATPTDV
ncbi:MAG: nitrate/nitrite transporter [Halopenitus sp.]